MDRNSAIGLTLIGALLLAYFYFFSPTPQPVVQKPVTTEVLSSGAKDSTQTKTVGRTKEEAKQLIETLVAFH